MQQQQQRGNRAPQQPVRGGEAAQVRAPAAPITWSEGETPSEASHPVSRWGTAAKGPDRQTKALSETPLPRPLCRPPSGAPYREARRAEPHPHVCQFPPSPPCLYVHLYMYEFPSYLTLPSQGQRVTSRRVKRAPHEMNWWLLDLLSSGSKGFPGSFLMILFHGPLLGLSLSQAPSPAPPAPAHPLALVLSPPLGAGWGELEARAGGAVFPDLPGPAPYASSAPPPLADGKLLNPVSRPPALQPFAAQWCFPAWPLAYPGTLSPAVAPLLSSPLRSVHRSGFGPLGALGPVPRGSGFGHSPVKLCSWELSA
ncbi:Voltage-Dependent L-Type Calcium Channel Subunit Beta-2 [Manis pentadactyla]|nr:Voltage-Dependent L-Type Calcium Channel Subunit Beta-2 [Manis pentadactyla]